MGVQTETKQRFSIQDGYRNLTDKLQHQIEKTIDLMTKEINVRQIEGFEDFFVVRNFRHGPELEKESSEHTIENIGYVTLVAKDNPDKKIHFGVWKKIKPSILLQ